MLPTLRSDKACDELSSTVFSWNQVTFGCGCPKNDKSERIDKKWISKCICVMHNVYTYTVS